MCYSQVHYFDYEYGCTNPEPLDIITVDEKTIRLEWEPRASASSYIISQKPSNTTGMSTSSIASASVVKTVVGNQLILNIDPSKEYIYTIKTRCVDGQSSMTSRSYYYSPPKSIVKAPCQAPDHFSVDLSNNKAVVTWDAIEGASNLTLWYSFPDLSTDKLFVVANNSTNATIPNVYEGVKVALELSFTCDGETVVSPIQTTTLINGVQYVGECHLPNYLGFYVRKLDIPIKMYKMQWNNTGGNYVRYQLRYKPVESLQWIEVSRRNPYYETPNLTPGIEYEYEITYFCSEEESQTTEKYRFTIDPLTGIGGGSTQLLNFTSDPLVTGKSCVPPIKSYVVCYP